MQPNIHPSSLAQAPYEHARRGTTSLRLRNMWKRIHEGTLYRSSCNLLLLTLLSCSCRSQISLLISGQYMPRRSHCFLAPLRVAARRSVTSTHSNGICEAMNNNSKTWRRTRFGRGRKRSGDSMSRRTSLNNNLLSTTMS